MDDFQTGGHAREWPWLQYFRTSGTFMKQKLKHDWNRREINLIQCGNERFRVQYNGGLWGKQRYEPDFRLLATAIKGRGRVRCEREETDIEQSVLRGSKRRVQGSNGLNSARLSRPRGSTQTRPSDHNRVQYLCSDGHAVIKAWGIAHIPGVVPRDCMTRLLSEKCPYTQRWRNQSYAIGMGLRISTITATTTPSYWNEREVIWATLEKIPLARRQPGGALSHEQAQWTINATVGWVPSGHGAIWCRSERQKCMKAKTRRMAFRPAVERELQCNALW